MEKKTLSNRKLKLAYKKNPIKMIFRVSFYITASLPSTRITKKTPKQTPRKVSLVIKQQK